MAHLEAQAEDDDARSLVAELKEALAAQDERLAERTRVQQTGAPTAALPRSSADEPAPPRSYRSNAALGADMMSQVRNLYGQVLTIRSGYDEPGG